MSTDTKDRAPARAALWSAVQAFMWLCADLAGLSHPLVEHEAFLTYLKSRRVSVQFFRTGLVPLVASISPQENKSHR